MCGISGILGKDFNLDCLNKMTNHQVHRGPDNQDIYYNQEMKIGFGHTRLSIIDTSEVGNQPFQLKDNDNYVMIYNGEIYNYQELKEELKALGYRFYTSTDTEVLLTAFIVWKEKCLLKIRGMFAFAIWNKLDSSLFFARDRLGIKPFYYSLYDDTLYFASEVLAIIKAGIPKIIDNQSIWDYLSIGTIVQPKTIFKHISCLLSGEYAFFKNNKIEKYSYWNLKKETEELKKSYLQNDYQHSIKLFKKGFTEATKYHLVSDVSVGAFLSGGVDSSAVVALMAKETGRAIKTFTIGFESKYSNYNEAKYARLVANQLQTEHTEIILTEQDFQNGLSSLLASFDQPSIDGTNTWFVSKFAAQEVKVALSGLGGDEFLAGYPQFQRIYRYNQFFPNGIKWLNEEFIRSSSFIPGRIRLLLQGMAATPLARYQDVRNLLHGLSPGTISHLLEYEDSLNDLSYRYEPHFNLFDDSISNTSYVEINTYLRDTLLRDADNMSMAHSLELRPVLLDHKLAEIMFALPSNHKIKNGRNKAVLIDSVKDLLPEEIFNRPKMGFEFPLGQWLFNSASKEVISIFNHPIAHKIFKKEYLMKIKNNLLNRKKISNQVWAYFILLHYLIINKVEFES